MASMNRVFLMGNLTRDPEVRYLPAGQAVTELRLAVNRKFKTQKGEEKEEVCFVDVNAWGVTAENCAKYLNKGSQILVEGRLQYHEWEKDGKKNSRLRVHADNVQFMGAPRGARGGRDEAVDVAGGDESVPAHAISSPEPARPPVPTSASDAGESAPQGGGDEDNLPF